MSRALLRSGRFLPLFLTQGLGAINDNLFKNALVVLALYRLAHVGPVLVALAGGVFILPYALFSSAAGQLADAREKSRLIRLVKFWELFLALLATAGFLTGSFVVLMAVLAGLGVQATFFSPLKYGILPDHLAEAELVAGNGLIEAGTFIGILLGTVAGGALVLLPAGPVVVSGAVIAVAVAGIAAAFQIPPAPAAAPGLRPDWNVARETALLLRQAAGNPPVWFAILGISWFWAVGATLLAEFPTIARDALHADGHVVTLMLGVFAVGVGVGSLAVARILRAGLSLRYVAIAGIGVSVFAADFANTAVHAGHLADIRAVLAAAQGWHLLLDLLVLAAFGGGYSVPLYVLLQERSAASHRARMIAANNVMNAVASVVAAGLTAGLYAAGVSGAAILALIAAANVGVAAWVFGTVRRAAWVSFRGRGGPGK
jgi:MFS family permease